MEINKVLLVNKLGVLNQRDKQILKDNSHKVSLLVNFVQLSQTPKNHSLM